MKWLAWIISAVNIYLGLRYFLNLINVLQTSKYSQSATAIYAVVFTGMGIAGFYFSLIRHNERFALLIGIGPWILLIVFLFFNMIFGDYK